MHILFLTPYPIGEAPSQRFRFEQYFEFLIKNGFSFETSSFWTLSAWRILYEKGHITRKFFGLLKGYCNRIGCLLTLHKFDKVFVHREVTPMGPPLFEWIITKLFKKPIIYDFDDSIWLPAADSTKYTLLSKFKYPKKAARICSLSSKVSCGNSYLATYAGQFNNRVIINPTTIDESRYHIPAISTNLTPIIGWTGTHSTLPYLDLVLPVLQRLRSKYDFTFKVICNKAPTFDFSWIEFAKWNKAQEIKELNSIDIGIMPLPDTLWTKGKCGFKILQFMSLEKATLASPIGVNKDIIDHGVNGFLCQNEAQWEKYLEKLLLDNQLRLSVGRNGRKTVQRNYSVNSNSVNFIQLFN